MIVLQRLGAWSYRVLLILLPRRLRAQVQDELVSTFDSGQRHFRNGGGVVAMLRFTLKELTGLVAMAINARRRDAWGTATALPNGRSHPAAGDSAPEFGTHLFQDVKMALRSIARRPALTLLAVITLAVGIATSSAMFSVIDAVLLRPLPHVDSHELVTVYPTIPTWRGHATLNSQWNRGAFSYPEFVEWRELQTTFEMGAVIESGAERLTGTGDPERIAIARSSWELFPMLGVPPMLGRTFLAEDDNQIGERVALLSAAFWRRRFGADPSILGRTIRLSDIPHTVIGVLPDGFEVTEYRAALWTPIGGPPDEGERMSHSLRMIARLKDGMTVDRAQVETEQLLLSLSDSDHIQHGANVVPRLSDVTRTVRAPLVILVSSSLLLLVVACGNAAALLLGAGIEREQELAVRGALGAGRSRLVRQLLTESLVLAVLAGIAGIFLAAMAMELLVMIAPADVPRLEAVQLDARVVGIAAFLSALSGVLFGLIPAMSLSRTDLVRAIQASRGRNASRSRLQAGVVAAQMALATVLLVAAGLLTRTLVQLNAVDPGFEADGLLSVTLYADYRRFAAIREAGGDADAAINIYYQQLHDALASLPGVEEIGITSSLPFGTSRANNPIQLEGYEPAEGELLLAERYLVTANYLDVMRTRLLEGRGFTAADDRAGAAPVVLVNQDLARHAWPGESAIGKRLTYYGGEFIIVGVVDNVRDRNLARSSGLQYYVPRGRRGGQFGSFVLRVAGDVTGVASLVRSRIWSVDPDLPVTSVLPMSERLARSLAAQQFRARLMLAFSALAIALALLGVYGVTARSVAWRTREMGIRVALGAEQSRVMALVLRQGVHLALFGAGAGLVVSLAATRVLESFLYGTEPTDALTLLVVAASVGIMSLIASFPPSLRATRVDPMIALRSE